MQERWCQQHSPLPALSAGESPTPPPLPASAGADLLQSPGTSNALLPKDPMQPASAQPLTKQAKKLPPHVKAKQQDIIHENPSLA